MSLFESFDIFGLFDAENHRKVDYFIANNQQIMQSLFEIICGLFATFPIMQAIEKIIARGGAKFRK